MSFFWSFGSTKKEPPQAGGSPAPDQHHQAFKTMSTQFRKGVQYNMKIVIRGDVMTGKSTLFHRLQGGEFEAAYNSTPEIQVANIPWQYKESNDIIKIEVWDVVDTAHNKTKADTGIKLEHAVAPKLQDEPSMDLGLDASTVNVYRNSHAALFLFDITKQWTFDYVNNELANVPQGVSVLVLGNFSDKSAERVVSLEEIHATLYQHNQERIEKGAIKPNLIRYAEASMKTGLGLQYIYDYLGVPFLQLQMESFKKQLELKAAEIVDTLETLDTDDKVPEIMQRRRGQDNFDQPSDPHLARQREEMKNAWDQELEEIAADNVALEVPSPSFVRKETPPPPTAPVRGRRREGSLVSDSDRMPAAVDQFDAGELADDWFGEDTPAPANHLPKRQDSDNEDYTGNPMVAGDEDVESVEYYNTGKVVAAAPIQEPTIEQESEEEVEVQSPPATVFRSELGNVWDSTSENPYLQRQTRVESDSEDEDNAFSPPQEEDASHFNQAPFMTTGFGGYEEIGGDNDNPWSWDDKTKKEQEEFWAETKDDQPEVDLIVFGVDFFVY
ncbi:P-loop containing nucleoside triphosphate hydrolase protein [Fennellomyces sp. T-0311]|nr:P-loop containing nucleoside triphosphate hydrolase protein [Fennellomyces sp. T-0311]